MKHILKTIAGVHLMVGTFLGLFYGGYWLYVKLHPILGDWTILIYLSLFLTAGGFFIAIDDDKMEREEEKQPASECEESVIEKIRARRDLGRKKYGTTMERTDLSTRQWLIHAQEEAMDLAIYLERLIKETP